MAIIGQKVIPGVLDRYLGKTGYESQQIQGKPKDRNAPDNLYDYVPGVHSARGKFTNRSKRASAEVCLTLHRDWFTLGALATLVVAGAVLAAKANTR